MVRRSSLGRRAEQAVGEWDASHSVVSEGDTLHTHTSARAGFDRQGHRGEAVPIRPEAAE
jgi:hypothetical protein